jgi:hypothetical protein
MSVARPATESNLLIGEITVDEVGGVEADE